VSSEEIPSKEDKAIASIASTADRDGFIVDDDVVAGASGAAHVDDASVAAAVAQISGEDLNPAIPESTSSDK
jgi:hypothetical protein